MSEADISRVIQVFEDQRAGWVLVGAHAVGLLTQPRATADFNFIVQGTKVEHALQGLAAEFGPLGDHDIGAAIELKAIDVDLIRSTNHHLFQVALEQPRTIGTWKLPRTEVLVVLKFLAAVNPWRERNKRRRDIVDLAAVYQAANELAEPALDRAFMLDLSREVYPGADQQFSELLDRIDRGDPIAI